MNRLMRYFLSLLLSFGLSSAVYANAPSEKDGVVSIASGANTISLPGYYSHITVSLSSGSSTVNITFNSGVTASASNYLMQSGEKLQFGVWGFAAASNQINYYGNGTTGTISWMAW